MRMTIGQGGLDPRLERLLEAAKQRKPTRDELRRQREAFVYGNLPVTHNATRAEVRESCISAAPRTS